MNYARKNKKKLEEVKIDTNVLKYYSEEEIIQKKQKLEQLTENGLIISGVYLEGAQWSIQRNCLTDSPPLQLFCEMPLICLEPFVGQIKKQYNYSCPFYKTLKSCFILGIKISETILDQEDNGQTQLLLTDPLKEEIFYTYLDKKRIKIGFLKSDGESTKESEKPSSAIYVPDVDFDFLKASIGGNKIYLISQNKSTSQKLYVQIYDINYNIDLLNFLVQSFETIKTFHWGFYTLTLSKSDYIVINAGLEDSNAIDEKTYSINSIHGGGSLNIESSTATIYQNLVSTDSSLNNKFNSIPNTNLQVILMGDNQNDILNIITIDVEKSSQNYIHKVCDSTEYDLYNRQNYKYLDSGIINEYFGYIKAGNPASLLFFNPTTCKFYKYGQQFLRYDDITFEQESTTFYTQDIQGSIYLYVQQQNDVKRITIPPPSLYCQVWDQNQVCKKCVEQKVQKLLVNNKCNCPINYYLNNNTGECQLKCDIRCSDLGCDDNGNCYNCAQNHYFQGNNCIKCPSICSDCNTQYELQNITYSQYLDASNYQNLTNSCGCDKVPGYYYCLNNATQTQP
ncbi:Insulin-like growth factor binding protein, N-terminal [Pseudocohnilembus persalinus]|uniref:Insulin-like growth factor binding protein, N-terminal n=1 Tax=Pseudocohnilembus persalinus TaxID=266149 RepID=A0A0V0R598_PSEPJ|nr:Insulin-like growth factor binding protein, N-terminal [Pseudocohnilembus persalinus]|eukprot:KRX09659.1 Insulin-like growth factor binding protein, N-terminal [Pseudocohnilembus persalinus]